MATEKRPIVISCHCFVVGLVVIDHVTLVKCTSHRLSIVQFAQPNLEIGQSSNSILLNICATFSEMTDFEMPSWGNRKPEEAPQGQGRRAVRQAVAEGGSERDVTRRLVDVLATLSLVNAAELRELTATVFKTHLVPGSERVSEAMAEAGRIFKSKPEAERADAQEQLCPLYVHVWVAFLRSLAATRELAPEHVAVSKSYWESNVVKSAPVQLAAHVPHCRAKPCKKIEGKGRLDAYGVLPGPGHSPSRGSAGSSTAAAEGGEEVQPRPKRHPRARSIEAPNTDVREVERLAHRVEQYSLGSCVVRYWSLRWCMLSS